MNKLQQSVRNALALSKFYSKPTYGQAARRTLPPPALASMQSQPGSKSNTRLRCS